MGEQTERIDEILKGLEHHLPSEVQTVILYGSRAKGEARDDSDIDLALIYEESARPAIREKLDVMDRISQICFPYKADVQFFHELSITMKYEVISTGKVVMCKDTERYTDLVDVTLRDYLDWKPFIDRFDREMADAIRKGGFFG